jgi:hypothetical protein
MGSGKFLYVEIYALCVCWQLDRKCRTLVRTAFRRDGAIMFFDNFFANGQAYTRTLKYMIAVQALEDHKNFICVF